MHGSKLLLSLLAMMSLAAATGCNQDRTEAANLPRTNPTFVRDAAGDPEAIYRVEPGAAQPVEVPADREAIAAGYTIDAMIGQINGRPLYASQLLAGETDQTLRTVGANQPRAQFARLAGELLSTRLSQMVIEELMLAEAESDLTEQQQMGLQAMLRQYREDLISKHGKGSAELADQQMHQQLGYGLAEAVSQRRQDILIQQYIRENLRPRIEVTRREVERFYASHPEQFNPPAEVTMRLMLVTDPQQADAAAEALATGKPFAEVAQQYSTYRSQSGGLREPVAIRLAEYDSLAWPELNTEVRKLSEGQHTPRVQVGPSRWAWAYVEDVQQAQGQTLDAVYLEIERAIERAEFARLDREHREKLLDRSNFTPVDRMLDTLMQVAVNRYAVGD
jgi:hypothetical protein